MKLRKTLIYQTKKWECTSADQIRDLYNGSIYERFLLISFMYLHVWHPLDATLFRCLFQENYFLNFYSQYFKKMIRSK